MEILEGEDVWPPSSLVLDGLELVVQLVESQLVLGKALLQLADKQAIVMQQQLQGSGQGLVDQTVSPIHLLAPGHYVGGQCQES